MILFIILLSTLLLLTNGASRHFVSKYDIVGKIQIVAYPLDICLNYKVEIDLAAKNSYGIFSCNQNVITFTDYGTDKECMTATGTTSNYTDTSIPTGNLYSFNCEGEDNYAVSDGCAVSMVNPPPAAGGAICCMDGCLATTFATGVCVNNTGSYIAGECDETMANNYNYSTPGCNDANKEVITLSTNIGECQYYTRQLIFDIYRRMTACYENGTKISEDTYCNAYSKDPTINPSVSPTQSPTSQTSAPSQETGTDESVIFYVRYLVLLVMAMAVYIV